MSPTECRFKRTFVRPPTSTEGWSIAKLISVPRVARGGHALSVEHEQGIPVYLSSHGPPTLRRPEAQEILYWARRSARQVASEDDRKHGGEEKRRHTPTPLFARCRALSRRCRIRERLGLVLGHWRASHHTGRRDVVPEPEEPFRQAGRRADLPDRRTGDAALARNLQEQIDGAPRAPVEVFE